MTIMKKDKYTIQKREVEILELPSYNLINMNPLHYYGTSLNPLLFNGMFDAVEFLDWLSKHFGWIEYKFDGNVTIKDRDLLIIQVVLTGDKRDYVCLYLDCYHSFNIPIIPPFLYEVMEDVNVNSIGNLT